jgi:hypothetical protein
MPKTLSPVLRVSLFVLVLVSLACTLAIPGLTPATPSAPQASATPSVPLPPAIVETIPPAGGALSLNAPIVIYFNQAMDHASVESAMRGLPAGSLIWADDSTLIFTPAQAYAPNTDLILSLGVSARTQNGMTFPEPVTLSFKSADYLRLAHTLPVDRGDAIAPDSAVVASFNQPVVALGADESTLPAGLTLEPAAQGKGEWINTSTYIFYPSPSLSGGVTYTAHVNPQLTSTSGAPLDVNAQSAAWSFTVALPRLEMLEPALGTMLDLDPKFTLTFNQPMNRNSVENNLRLSGADGLSVPGKFSWNERGDVVTFAPNDRLARNTDYTLTLAASASALGGVSLGADQQYTFRTYGDFYVSYTDPAEGRIKQNYYSANIAFTAPIAKLKAAELAALITIVPDLPNTSLYADGVNLSVYGSFTPETKYIVTISGDLADRWGQKLGQKFQYSFTTAKANPAFIGPPYSVFMVRPDDPSAVVQYNNVETVDYSIAPLSLQNFFQHGTFFSQGFLPDGLQTRTVNLAPTNGRSTRLSFNLSPGGELAPGVYYVKFYAPQMEYNSGVPSVIVSSNVNVTFKIGATQVLVWAMDVRTNEPVANKPVTIYDQNGAALASGQTDANGLMQADIPARNENNYYNDLYALLGKPGDDQFGMGYNNWGYGIDSWDFAYSANYEGPHDMVYIYTDRPIYRPGQTVYYRGVWRTAFDGRYNLPVATDKTKAISLEISGPTGVQQTLDLPVSAYGTFNGEYKIPDGAEPGYYAIASSEAPFYFNFQVAEYRKPEINLTIDAPAQILKGRPGNATISAQYYFGAPAGDLPVHWYLYQSDSYFYLPDYTVGLMDSGWMVGNQNASPFGTLITEAEARTSADGTLTITLPGDLVITDTSDLTLEVTATEPGGFSVSARKTITIHPADFYIGIRPNAWVGQAGTALGFSIQTVTWEKASSAPHDLKAEFKQVEWQREEPVDFGPYVFTPIYTPVDSADIAVAPDGTASVSFTPQQAGTYVLEVSGNGARSQALVWVGGSEQAVWPNLPFDRIRLTADKDSYNPGESAQVFIPNPLGGEARALVSVERGTLISSQTITVPAGGTTVTIPLDEFSAPNVYVAVTLIRDDTFREGLINLPVNADALELNVDLTSQPTRSEPGGEVTFGVRVTDSKGKPVQGEFSLAVVDLAVLALADPNSIDILPAFYDIQPIGFKTTLGLAAYGKRFFEMGGGMGGGGGDGIPTVREKFPDTAYWKANIVTDADGRATVKMTLPDNLTTWHVDVRGLTQDTRVGQAALDLIATKDLLIRPITPRFFVVGDHATVSAIVNNNTAAPLKATASLAYKGFKLDDPTASAQVIDVPANGRTLVTWTGIVDNVDQAELIFSVQAGALKDASRPTTGSIPILHYAAPQTFSTAGVIPEAGSRLEVISLPRSYSPLGGDLKVELSPSLAASILGTLKIIEAPDQVWSPEQVLSYFLPNLETYRTLKDAGIDSPELQEKLAASLDASVRQLIQFQNEDGGWPWYPGEESDPSLSAYAVFGLARAREAGVDFELKRIDRGREYLNGARIYISDAAANWELDQAAWNAFVLQISGGVDPTVPTALYKLRDRLSPWAKAYLALAMDAGDDNARQLISDLQSTAIRSATGAHWESLQQGWHNPGTPLYNTAVVVYALAQRDPASLVMTDAVRYLASQRDALGWWSSPYETTWVILALDQAMKGTGDLQADFAFSAMLNNAPFASGQASGAQNLTTVTASAPLDQLTLAVPNALNIIRQSGSGRLYYRAVLDVDRPVESAPALNKGISLTRQYQKCAGKDCADITAWQLQAGENGRITVRLTLNIPNDSYYLRVEDYIPAGTELLDTTLKTSQQGEGGTNVEQYDPEDPFAFGWGWWYFSAPQIYDNHIAWAATYLPAGTYVLTYTLVPTHAGEFRVLPAHAWLTYFPEVQGTTAGTVFDIRK